MNNRSATVLTHRRAKETAAALKELRAAADRADVTLRFDANETAKHGLQPAPGIEIDAPVDNDVDLCVVLGGDGTIFAALRQYADIDVPVFAVKFGDVGFLATCDPNDLGKEFDGAFAGEYETLQLPTVTAQTSDGSWIAINDISLHRKPGLRVAELAYALGGEEIGRVRCDGLVVSTPAGSTGYNLANGGPVLAWGVKGFIVSFIAPHSLTARPLVVAPDDRLAIQNISHDEPVELHTDARPVYELKHGEQLQVAFGRSYGTLALLPGVNFYHRLRERFGRLAQ